MGPHLHRDLENLKKEILTMGGMVEEAIERAIRALTERQADLAQSVIERDHELDLKEVRIEEDCLKLLALHQPVARDLRFIIAVMKVNNDLERMGDLAVNIAERAAYLSARDPLRAPLGFADMVTMVRSMVSESLDALVNQDPHLARSVCARDDQVDDANRRMFTLLQRFMAEDPKSIDRAMHLLSVSRHLERVADAATNIAEDVVFMVEGEIIRHRTEDFNARENHHGV